MFKKSVLVFTLAFILNWIWEVAHSALYLNYQGGLITSFILFRAAIGDAVIILAIILIAEKFKFNKPSFIVISGLIVAFVIETWALPSNRWAYNSLMPIIPIIKIGLTPAIQLAVTGFIAVKTLKI